MTKNNKLQDLPWLAALLVVAATVFSFVFNPKPDFNGDNCYYYANATSLAAGRGYADMFGEPTNNFPPGYPLLMVPLRLFTSSIIAQKVLNLVFLGAGVVLLFFILTGAGFKRSLSFLICSAVIVTPHILEFSTIMMSEASCICCIMLVLWLYMRMPQDEREQWRSPLFYGFLAALVFSFYIRTQCMALIAAFTVTFLLAKRWRSAIAVAAAFAVGYAPWMIRNALLDLGQSRYIEQIEPTKIADTLKMLVSQAIPESIIPFMDVDYDAVPDAQMWLVAAVWLVLIVYGAWTMKRLRLPILLTLAGTLAIVSLIDTPSRYRYIIIVLPMLTAAFMTGIWKLGTVCWKRITGKELTPWLLILLFVPIFPLFKTIEINNKHTIWGLYVYGRMETPDNLRNFYAVGQALRQYDRNAVVATRKPELFYLHSGLRGKYFLETSDERALIKDLIDKKVGYVVIDQLGYPATFEYLLPCTQHHPEIFRPIIHEKNPHTFVLQIDRFKAIEWLRSSGN